MFEKKTKSIIMSYIALRRLIGILGILLPFICVLGGLVFADLPKQQSISFYYHTNMRDFFVGLLIAVSMFLITYKGYKLLDSVVTSVIGIAGFGIAVFPTLRSDAPLTPVGLFQINSEVANVVHIICAGVFFALLAMNSLFLFTKSKGKDVPMTENKKIRNGIYIACGIIILISLIVVAVLGLTWADAVLNKSKMVLLCETVMLFFFGLSWLIKGETVYKDGKKLSGEIKPPDLLHESQQY